MISFQTSTRFTPYIIGIMFGFYIERMEIKKQNLKGMSKLLLSTFWMVSFSMLLFLVTIYLTDVILLIPDDVAVHVFPFADVAYKLLASICVGWTAMACHFGRGGFLNSIFSCGVFKILSKLCLGVYLIHYRIMIAYVNMKTEYSTLKLEEMVNILPRKMGVIKSNLMFFQFTGTRVGG